MYSDAQKIHLLEKLIQTKDDAVLIQVENYLATLEKGSSDGRKKAQSLQGMLSRDDADELNAIIEDGCEKIDQDGWK